MKSYKKAFLINHQLLTFCQNSLEVLLVITNNTPAVFEVLSACSYFCNTRCLSVASGALCSLQAKRAKEKNHTLRKNGGTSPPQLMWIPCPYLLLTKHGHHFCQSFHHIFLLPHLLPTTPSPQMKLFGFGLIFKATTVAVKYHFQKIMTGRG